ncbi:MAG: guanylate kinase [Bacteroidia bacterium]|nr:guanylate kinase [Bacteroidia bacterium]
MGGNKLVIFSAPSGAGKTTLVKHVLNTFPDQLEFSVSATSRPKRGEEIHGKDYYFISTEEFQKKIDNDEFLEWEEVYKGVFYGTLKSEVNKIWQKGKTVVFDIDVEGGLNLKEKFGRNALAIFVMPPSIKILEERLKKRNTDSPQSIERRIAKAENELKTAQLFDVCIINEDLEKAKKESEKIVLEFLNKPI